MSPDDCIEMIARPFGVTPELQSFVLEWAGHKVRVTVESNSGSTTSLSITAYGRSFPKINLTREGGFERLGKQLRIAREAQLGEAIFDAKVYVDTTLTEEQVRQVLGAPSARQAVLDLFREVHEVELRPNGAFVSTFTVDQIAHDPARLPPLLTQLVTLVDAIPAHVSELVARQPKRYTPGGGLILGWALTFTVLVIAISVVVPWPASFTRGWSRCWAWPGSFPSPSCGPCWWRWCDVAARVRSRRPWWPALPWARCSCPRGR
jgi:hypothetical protein